MPNLQQPHCLQTVRTKTKATVKPGLLLGNLGVVEHLQSLVTRVVSVDSACTLCLKMVQWADDAVAFGLVALAQHKHVVALAEGIREDTNGPNFKFQL